MGEPSKILTPLMRSAALAMACGASTAAEEQRDEAVQRLVAHDAALRAERDEAVKLLKRIVDTWPHVVIGGVTRPLCPACGMRCPDGDKCMLPDLRRLGVST